MNHLNFFTYYQNMNPKHENNLTRAFLVCLENIPAVQLEFFSLITKSYPTEIFDENYSLDLIVEEVYTQISNQNLRINRDDLRGRRLISVLISDELLNNTSEVSNDERNAIYDGFVLCKPNLVFIIENKPNIKNVWEKQLNPNVQSEHNIKIEPVPCSIKWSEIIFIFNRLLNQDNLINIEKRLCSDFLSYIDLYRPELNPYVYFESCNGNKNLINKRCKDILSKIKINGVHKEAKYHYGWGNYIESGKNTVTQIKIDYFEKEDNKFIRLDMVAADTQNASKETYKQLNINSLLELMSDDSIEVYSNFHYQHMNKNLLWFKGNASFPDYLNFWKSNQHLFKQINRNIRYKSYSFEEFNQLLVTNGIIDISELSSFESKITSKKYMTLNVCAGFVIVKYWPIEEAIELDNKEEFTNSASKEIERIYNVFNQTIL